MHLKIDSEFIGICEEILAQKFELKDWRLIESCDQFQTPKYCGGFDAVEDEFTFSYFDIKGDEYWFQIELSNIEKIAKKQLDKVVIRKAE